MSNKKTTGNFNIGGPISHSVFKSTTKSPQIVSFWIKNVGFSVGKIIPVFNTKGKAINANVLKDGTKAKINYFKGSDGVAVINEIVVVQVAKLIKKNPLDYLSGKIVRRKRKGMHLD